MTTSFSEWGRGVRRGGCSCGTTKNQQKQGLHYKKNDTLHNCVLLQLHPHGNLTVPSYLVDEEEASFCLLSVFAPVSKPSQLAKLMPVPVPAPNAADTNFKFVPRNNTAPANPAPRTPTLNFRIKSSAHRSHALPVFFSLIVCTGTARKCLVILFCFCAS